MNFVYIIILLGLSISLSAMENGGLTKLCQEHNASACYQYALSKAEKNKSGNQELSDDGIIYMREACSLLESKACDFLATYYFDNKLYGAAVPYLNDSCNRGSKDACLSLGSIYRDGHDVRIDDVKSREYYEKACTLKSGDACYAVALVYRAGFGVKKDRFQEKSFYKKACDNGLKAGCDRFTEMDDEDKGIKRSFWEKIKSLF